MANKPYKRPPPKCWICYSLIGNRASVDCDNCRLTVHTSCYGTAASNHSKDGPFYCTYCENRPKKTKANAPLERAFRPGIFCAICKSKKFGALKPCVVENENSSYGSNKSDNRQLWAHLVCALWTPQTWFGDIESFSPIHGLSNLKSQTTVRCQVCNKDGATIKCRAVNCNDYYHPICLLELSQKNKGQCAIMEETTLYGRTDLMLYAYCTSHAPYHKSCRKKQEQFAKLLEPIPPPPPPPPVMISPLPASTFDPNSSTGSHPTSVDPPIASPSVPPPSILEQEHEQAQEQEHEMTPQDMPNLVPQLSSHRAQSSSVPQTILHRSVVQPVSQSTAVSATATCTMAENISQNCAEDTEMADISLSNRILPPADEFALFDNPFPPNTPFPFRDDNSYGLPFDTSFHSHSCSFGGETIASSTGGGGGGNGVDRAPMEGVESSSGMLPTPNRVNTAVIERYSHSHSANRNRVPNSPLLSSSDNTTAASDLTSFQQSASDSRNQNNGNSGSGRRQPMYPPMQQQQQFNFCDPKVWQWTQMMQQNHRNSNGFNVPLPPPSSVNHRKK